MNRILSLLLVTSSILPMQLDLIHTDKKMSKLSHYISSKVSNKTHIKPSSVFVPNKLGSVELYHGNKGFYVRQDDKKYEIKKYFTDPMVRDITKKQLKAFLECGYLSLNQMDDGEYSLQAKGRINGGGPIAGIIAYWVTKTLCYGVLAAGIGASMIRKKDSVRVRGSNGSLVNVPVPDPVGDIATDTITRGVTSIANNATVPLTYVIEGSAINTVTSIGPKIISTAPLGASGPAISLVSQVIQDKGGGEAAKLVTGAGIMVSSTTKLGIVGSIELLAVKVGLFFGMTPTP